MKSVVGVLYGSVVFEPDVHQDEQGFVSCTFDAEIARRGRGGPGPPRVQEFQDCHTRTPRGGVRGLNIRTDGGEGKLVRCVHGSVVNVAVDLRPTSPTYRLWMTVVLDDVAHQSGVGSPQGLAHGFQALTETADVCTRINRIHRSEYDITIRPDDPDLGIPWPLPVTGAPGHDEEPPALAVVEPMLSEWFGEVL